MNIFLRFTILSLMCLPCLAQHNNRSVRNLQFRFDNPGARSLGVGGAFTGMADDASAVLANPAGLTQLKDASFSLETSYIQNDIEIPFYAGNIVQENLFDFDFQFESKTFSDNSFQVPFISFVKPMDSFHLGLFYYQQAKVKRSYTTDTLYIFPLDELQDQVRYFPTQDKVDILMQDLGISLARKFSESFSVGLSVLFSQMDYLANSTSLAENAIGEPTPAYQKAEGDDSGFGFFGGLFYVPNPWLSLGVSYKIQPEFTYTASLEQPTVIWQNNFEKEAKFKVPDSLSFGLSYRATDFFLIMLDVQRVFYSQLVDNFVDFNGLDGLYQTVDDVTELHFGMEKIMPRIAAGKTLILRAGYWLDPYHAPLNNFDDNQLLEGDYADGSDVNFRDAFFLHQFKKDVEHFNVGLGLGLSKSMHMDFAADYSTDTLRFSLSAVYRLGQ